MTRVPPKRAMNSAGEATVKSRCRSILRCSRLRFARCSPDMLGLRGGETIGEAIGDEKSILSFKPWEKHRGSLRA